MKKGSGKPRQVAAGTTTGSMKKSKCLRIFLVILFGILFIGFAALLYILGHLSINDSHH